MASGGIAGSVSLALLYPLDYARSTLIDDFKNFMKGGEKKFTGMIDFYKKTLASDGFFELYKGFYISCVRILIYRSFYFGVFDSVKPLLPKELVDRFIVNFLLGWSVTVTAGLVSYPIDTIRRRMMMNSNSN